MAISQQARVTVFSAKFPGPFLRSCDFDSGAGALRDGSCKIPPSGERSRWAYPHTPFCIFEKDVPHSRSFGYLVARSNWSKI